MGVVAFAIVARSAIFIFTPAHFDSDQAVIGLMAKHLSEGRALPLFLYGENYILAVEAWMAAPSFLVAGASIAALKLPLLAVNLATAFLLLRLLEKESGLRPALAAVAILPFVMPQPSTAAMLVEANGVNVEPFLYVPLLWATRRRPTWFGVIFAIGFLQREFTVFALIALVVVAAVTGDLFRRQNIRTGLAAMRVAAEVWLVITLVKPYASGAGPGTTIGEVRAPANNVTEALGRICLDSSTIVEGVGRLFSEHWARLFSATVEPLSRFGIESNITQGVAGSWLLLAAAMMWAIVRIVMAVASAKKLRREQVFGAYLFLVGLLTAATFVVARCGARGPTRYALLSMYLVVGISAWYLATEDKPVVRNTWVAVLACWCAVNAFGHARLWAEYLTNRPVAEKQLIIRHLEARGIKYAASDYWIAYYISFVTGERIIVTSSDMVRVLEYDRQVTAHASEAIRISRAPCGRQVMNGIYFCEP